MPIDELYACVSETRGCDVTGDGTKHKPYKTVLRAVKYLDMTNADSHSQILVDTNETNRWAEVPLPKVKEFFSRYLKQRNNQECTADRLAENNKLSCLDIKGSTLTFIDILGNGETRVCKVMNTELDTNVFKMFSFNILDNYQAYSEQLVKTELDLELAEAGLIQSTKNQALPEALPCKLKDVGLHAGKRVVVSGWAHRISSGGRQTMFVILRDGTGYLQCIFNRALCSTWEAILLTPESTLTVYGTVQTVPECGDTPGGVIVLADYWKLIATSSSENAEIKKTRFWNSLTPFSPRKHKRNDSTGSDLILPQPHMTIRNEIESKILRAVSLISQAFREHYKVSEYTEVMPPTFVSNSVEKPEKLYTVEYYSHSAYLSQSSQLYLETCLPALGDVFSITRSFRNNNVAPDLPGSNERPLYIRSGGHLSEFIHIEAECPFINFNDLLDRVEDLIMDVTDRVMKKAGNLIYRINPKFNAPTRPFRRMRYEEAIHELNRARREINDRLFEFGDCISEIDGCYLASRMNQMVFITHFPTQMKSFYMSKSADDQRLTDSFELFAPGIGNIAGGSMRIENVEELLQAYKEHLMDPSLYDWYTDQRRYGSCPHGGYGLGFERFCWWLMNQISISDVCLYPRFTPLCRP